jgi:hypothetical protein
MAEQQTDGGAAVFKPEAVEMLTGGFLGAIMPTITTLEEQMEEIR